MSEPHTAAPTTPAPPAATTTETEPETTLATPSADEVLDDDLLVEEVSIDGMCGVY